MEVQPVAVVKRKSSDRRTQFELCLFCQSKKTEKPQEGSNEANEQSMALNENKAYLAEFLSQEIISRTKSLPSNCHLVVGSGFPDPDNAQANSFDAEEWCVDHEEADTRIVIHAKHVINSQFGRIVVECRNTDVLLLLVYHVGSLDIETWMESGTSKAKKCFPVHDIARKLGADVIHNLLGFHSLTGCDTTLLFCGISKNSCRKKYVESPVVMGILRAQSGIYADCMVVPKDHMVRTLTFADIGFS